MRRKIITILSGNAGSAILLLARNLMIARLISVEDYGVATTFALTMALVEMSTQFGLQQQIVQDADGDDPHFQAVMQGFQVLRGVTAGVLMFALAGPIAAFLNIPDVAWAYQVMALMPILRALQHFDIHRFSRSMKYGPMLLTGVIPAAVSLAAIFPLALWMTDYRVMLFALLLQEALGVLTSHVLASRPYRLAFDRAIIARSLSFGWPLLLNGLLLFLVMQGDKLIVGRQLGMAALGVFGMGITLTLTPTLILAKSTQSFFLPQLSTVATTQDAARFNAMACATFQAGLLNGVMMLLGAFILGIPLLHLLLGDKFADLQPLLIWLAAQQGIRVFKSGPSTVAVACAVTSNALYPNLVRIIGLPIAWAAVANGGGLWDVVFIALVTEGMGYAVALLLARVRLGIKLRPLVPSLMACAIVIALTLSLPPVGAAGANIWLNIAVLIAAPVLLLATMQDLRAYLRLHAKRKV